MSRDREEGRDVVGSLWSSDFACDRTCESCAHAMGHDLQYGVLYHLCVCGPCDGESPEPRRDDYVFTGPGPAPSRTVCVGSLVSLSLLPERVRFGFPFVSTFVSRVTYLVCRAVPGRSPLGIRGARMAREMRAEKRQPRLVFESTLYILPRFTFNLGLADVQVRPEPEPERSCDRLRVSRRHDPSRSPLGLRPLVEAPWMCGEWEGWD